MIGLDMPATKQLLQIVNQVETVYMKKAKGESMEKLQY